MLKKTEADLTKGKDKLEKMVKDLEQEKVSAVDVSVWGRLGHQCLLHSFNTTWGTDFLNSFKTGLGRSVLADGRFG